MPVGVRASRSLMGWLICSKLVRPRLRLAGITHMGNQKLHAPQEPKSSKILRAPQTAKPTNNSCTCAQMHCVSQVHARPATAQARSVLLCRGAGKPVQHGRSQCTAGMEVLHSACLYDGIQYMANPLTVYGFCTTLVCMTANVSISARVGNSTLCSTHISRAHLCVQVGVHSRQPAAALHTI